MSLDPVLLIGVISALTALVASITGPLVTLYVAKANIRAAVRSANRQRWIDEFRDLVARFAGQVATAVQVRDKVIKEGRYALPANIEILEQFEKVIYTATKIRLMVNPLEREHQALLDEISGLIDRFRNALPHEDMQADGEATVRRIVEMSLRMIRNEWARVQRGL